MNAAVIIDQNQQDETLENITRHVRVKVRHSDDCAEAHRDGDKKFGDYQKCHCRKWLLYYDNSGQSRTLSGTVIPAGETIPESAKTRLWSEAQAKAQQWSDQFDPIKVENKRLKEEKRRKEAEDILKTVTVEEAIGRFIGSMILDKLEDSTINSFRGLLGYVDPTTFEVRRTGKLLEWIPTQNPGPVFVSDITRAHADAFQLSWKSNDRTERMNFGRLNQFFDFCVGHKWINENPMANRKRPGVKRGNRTGAFTDDQWLKIEATAEEAVETTKPKGLEEHQDAQRLLAFVELLRWSGMALHDASMFSFNDAPRCSVSSDGVLTYVRQKTKKFNRSAIVQLPKHVVELLNKIPEGRASKEQPFLEKAKDGQPMKAHSIKHRWWFRLTALYKAAGIGKIKNDIGTLKNPGAHILRDTFAVGILTSGIDNAIEVTAKCLGDTIKMVEDHYSPWIEKMRLHQATKSNEAMEAQLAQLAALRDKNKKKHAGVITIGGHRG
jgi:integrase